MLRNTRAKAGQVPLCHTQLLVKVKTRVSMYDVYIYNTWVGGGRQKHPHTCSISPMQHTAGHVSWKGQNNHALTHFASAGNKYNQRAWLFRSLLSLMLWLHWIKYLLLLPMLLIMTNAAHQAWREQSNHTFTLWYFGWNTFIIKDVRSGCFALSGRMLAP